MLGNDLWLKVALAVAGNLDWQVAEIAFQRFPALAVTRIAGGVGHRLMLVVAQVRGHFHLQGALDNGFGQLLQQPIGTDQVFGALIVRHQGVEQLSRYGF